MKKKSSTPEKPVSARWLKLNCHPKTQTSRCSHEICQMCSATTQAIAKARSPSITSMWAVAAGGVGPSGAGVAVVAWDKSAGGLIRAGQAVV